MNATADPSGEMAGLEQIGIRFVGDDCVFTGRDVDADEHRVQRRAGRGPLP